ncbi:MAG: hypothetical protein AB1758_05060, partial [Candidatus Eremiobacterota bacterium]
FSDYPDGAAADYCWLLLDVALLAALGGLTLYAASVSNLFYVMGLAHPQDSPLLYWWGCRLGVLAGLWITPATRGLRLALTTTLAVDFLVPWPWLVPLLQLATAAVALLWGRTGREALATAWRLSLGGTAGRILGRAVGFLLLGAEGVLVLEPIGEQFFAVLAATSGQAPPLPEAAPGGVSSSHSGPAG